jgi:uncharacterized iron-regulated membrane protein
MTVLGLLLTYWVGSGLIMAVYDATDPTQVWAIEGAGPGADLVKGELTRQPLPPLQMLRDGITTALARSSTLDIASVRLRMAGGDPEIEFATASGDRTKVLRFNAQSGRPMSALQADGDPDLPQPLNVMRRNAIKSWHRGNIIGITGQLAGLAAGLGLIAMVITGVGTYLRVWRRRLPTDAALFWSARESLWRRLHRWIAVVAAVLVLNLATTGSVLAIGEIQLWAFLNHYLGVPAPYPRPSPMPPLSDSALRGDIRRMLDVAQEAAYRSDPGVPITKIEIVSRMGAAMALVYSEGSQPRIKAFDAGNGRARADWTERLVQEGNGYFADWHQVVKRLHRGDIVGHFAGRYITLTTGVALAYLLISGCVMYAELLRRRRIAGRRGLFWR